MNRNSDLKCYQYKESVYIRLTKANIEPIKNNLGYRYVKLGDEIFPIHVDMVDTYNNSGRNFKRGMKKQYKKMLKKANRSKQKESINQSNGV